jgi:hypothetical protein
MDEEAVEDQLKHTGRELQRAEWGVIVALLVSAITAVFSGGVVYGQVQAQGVRLSKVEDKADLQAVAIARIDANVTFLVAQAQKEGNSGK